MSTRSSRSILPGFGLSLGFTIAYLSLIVLLPLSAVFLKTAGMTWAEFVTAVSSPFVISAYKVSFFASLAAASVNAVFGLIVAWPSCSYHPSGTRLCIGTSPSTCFARSGRPSGSCCFSPCIRTPSTHAASGCTSSSARHRVGTG